MRQAPLPAPRKRGASHAFRNHILRIAATRGFAEANAELYRHQQAAKEAANLALNRRSPQAQSGKGHGGHPIPLGESGKLGWTPEQMRAAGIAGVQTGPAGRALRQGTSDLVHAALGTPAAAAAIAKALGTDAATTARHPLRSQPIQDTETFKLGKAVAKQTASDLRHPLRHPGFTALDVVAALSAGAGTASRLGAAGDALRAGEGARGALTRPGHEGGSLLRKPVPGSTSLKLGGLEARKPLPDNPLLQPLAKGWNRYQQKRLDHPQEEGRRRPLAPENALGNTLSEQRQTKGQIAHAEGAYLRRVTKKLTKPEQTALRVVAVEGKHALRHPAETIQRHVETHLRESQAAKAPADTEMQRLIAEDLTRALPILENPSPKFLRALHDARKFSRAMTTRALERKLLSPQASESSRATLATAYGRFPGAEIKSFPKQKARVEQVREYPGKIIERTRPRTRAEAEQRLAKIDAANEEIAARLAGHTLPKGEQARRNRINGLIDLHERTGQSRPGTAKALRAGRQKTLSQEALDQAQRQLDEFAAKHPNHPVVRAYEQRITEGNQLRDLLNAPGDPFATPTPASDFGNVTETVASPGRRVRLKGRAAQRARTEIVGPNAERIVAPEGSFYFPTHERFIPSAAKSGGASFNPRPAQFGLAPPDKGRHTMGTLKRRTGKALKRGVVEDVPRALAQVHAGREKLYSAQDLYRDALRASTDKRVSPEQVPLRRTRAISPQLRRQLSSELEKARGGDETAMTRALQRLQDELSPTEHEHAPIGAQVPGVRWVDRRLLKGAAPVESSGISKVARQVNRPFRTLGVYGRPAYVANNYPQNVAMLAFHHGLKAPGLLKRAARAKRAYGPELVNAMEAATGTTRSESYLPRGRVGAVEHALSSTATRLTDRQPRLAAFLGRAAEKGYTSREQMTRLFHDPAAADDLHWVATKAKNDMVNFNVKPAERELSDFIYFYPWLSRSTVWAGRTALNRPLKTEALAQAGRTAQAKKLELQGGPPYAEGYLRVGKDRLINPHPMGPFSTQGQIAQSVEAIAKGNRSGIRNATLASEFGTPALNMAAGKLSDVPLTTAEGLIAQRLGLYGRHSKAFPSTDPADAILPSVLGAGYPRRADVGYLQEQGKKSADPATKLADVRAQQSVHLKNLVRKGALPRQQVAEYRKALDLLNERDAANAKIEKEIDSAHPRKRAVQKISALLEILQRGGLMDAAEAAKYRRYYSTNAKLTAKQINKDRDWFWNNNPGGAPGPLVSWFHKSAGGTD